MNIIVTLDVTPVSKGTKAGAKIMLSSKHRVEELERREKREESMGMDEEPNSEGRKQGNTCRQDSKKRRDIEERPRIKLVLKVAIDFADAAVCAVTVAHVLFKCAPASCNC